MKFAYWIPAIGLAVLIFFFSSMPKPPAPDLGIQFGDKVLHFIVYCFLGAFVAYAINNGRKTRMSKRQIVTAIVICSIYGMSDEFHQYFVDGRNADVMDWVADTLGGFAGAYIYLFISTISLKREKEMISDEVNTQ